MKKRLRSYPAAIRNARRFRKNPTAAERIVWNALRGRKLGGWKFRRQHPIQQFVLDFYCREKRIAIEIDGSVHYRTETAEYDAERTAFLSRYGIRILRFPNDRVMEDLPGVLEEIARVMEG